MSHRPLVSIITPTYNHEKYLTDCIESVISQTFTNWEMIILNDGSTDQTALIAEQFASRNEKITIVNQTNVGIFRLSETYNKGLALAKGKYIAILEGDDYWLPDKLEKQLSAFDTSENAVLCWSQARCVNYDRSINYYISPELSDADSSYFNNNPVGSVINIFLYRNCIPALTILIKIEALLMIGGFRQNFGLPLVDLPTLYELSLVGEFIFIPEPLGEWRNYASQITKTYPVEMTEGFYKLAISFLEDVRVKSLNLPQNSSDLHQYYRNRLVISYARSGRYRLIRKEYSAARKDYKKALSLNGFHELLWKLRAFTGLLFSFLHLNVEGLAGVLGKRTYGEK